jgi:hypothetical protein
MISATGAYSSLIFVQNTIESKSVLRYFIQLLCAAVCFGGVGVRFALVRCRFPYFLWPVTGCRFVCKGKLFSLNFRDFRQIWAMHFIGMQVRARPDPIRFLRRMDDG